ncbi:MAG TPA: hypothetical protein PK098_09680 [Phycisphaerales bacterium]|nr:hypothetical protein [Phycisphaerales bacterium]
MGFWHTGYMEFHEPVGLGDLAELPPEPVVYRCDRCGAVFESPTQLQTHRFEQHPVMRPMLFIRGAEVGNTPLRLIRPLSPNDIQTECATKAAINDEPVGIDLFAQRLSEIASGAVDISLTNDDFPQCFRIHFEIANPDDLEGVERCFLDAARSRRLDRRAIEHFIEAARRFPTAIAYCDGICEYFYGVLSKERNSETSLPTDAYREKFNRAAVALKDVPRTLAMTISALIAFHFNHFASAFDVCPHGRTSAASARMLHWLSGDTDATDAQEAKQTDRLDGLLTDHDTERILRWIVESPESIVGQLEAIEAAVDDDLPELDRVKLRILLAETYVEVSRYPAAKRHARELLNNPTFGTWAGRLLRRLQ